MKLSDRYKELMKPGDLPDRFRAGDFTIDVNEQEILYEFVTNFYESVEVNQSVPLEDFVEFMDFMDLLRDADTPEVQNVLTEAFMKSAEIGNRLTKE